MSGHSKWASIKRAKGATDIKRGKVFTQLAKAITVAARLGKNLDTAIEAARAANMPKENIDRAIKRGTGALGGDAQIEEVLYEAYGPGGAALLIAALTDNRNRTIGELRAIANKHGMTLANPGAVKFLFDERGILEVAIQGSADEAQLALIDCGVDDIDVQADRLVGYTAPDQLFVARRAAEQVGLRVLGGRIGFVPKTLHQLSVSDQEQLLHAMELIDDLDDVSSVETNALFTQ
ncbi:MAG: YebC/PmpR family DNA-binding transcriptional regulator [Patescibacteria group bacterium]|mgnify:CR=1 FL=1